MTRSFFQQHRASLLALFVLILFPFVVGLFDGASPAAVWANESGQSKFLQGLVIEIFILALFALSYDLIFGITGLLSFGHSMFFAVGAYTTGIAVKSFGLGLGPTLLLVLMAALAQALLFGIVLPRVKGLTFALVTLGMASVFHIIIQSAELGVYTGADVGLQGVIVPDFISPVSQRLRLYFISLGVLVSFFLLYKRFVDSPTGRVCVAIRENEDRAKMLGYNTFTFKLAALILSSITAALAGTLHTIYQPIVSPNTASLIYTVTALLIVLIGGVGTLSGAIIGAFVFRLLDFGLRRYIGEAASLFTGTIYVLFVLFIPFGIVGTWRARQLDIQRGRERLVRFVTGNGNVPPVHDR
jgi:branched-chain amino acid transport system permease protein